MGAHHQLWKKRQEIQIVHETGNRFEMPPVHVYGVAEVLKSVKRDARWKEGPPNGQR